MIDCAQSARASVREMPPIAGVSTCRHARSRKCRYEPDHPQRRRYTVRVGGRAKLYRIDSAREPVRIERERQAVRRRDVRSVGKLEMQMRPAGVAGVAQLANYLALLDRGPIRPARSEGTHGFRCSPVVRAAQSPGRSAAETEPSATATMPARVANSSTRSGAPTHTATPDRTTACTATAPGRTAEGVASGPDRLLRPT
jgi:hypothetical protein